MGEAVVVKSVIGHWRLRIPESLHPRPLSPFLAVVTLGHARRLPATRYPLPAPELDHPIAYAHVIAWLRERRRACYGLAVAHPEA